MREIPRNAATTPPLSTAVVLRRAEDAAKMYALQGLRMTGIIGSRKAQDIESLVAEPTWRGSR